eukprot:g9300.t1
MPPGPRLLEASRGAPQPTLPVAPPPTRAVTPVVTPAAPAPQQSFEVEQLQQRRQRQQHQQQLLQQQQQKQQLLRQQQQLKEQQQQQQEQLSTAPASSASSSSSAYAFSNSTTPEQFGSLSFGFYMPKDPTAAVTTTGVPPPQPSPLTPALPQQQQQPQQQQPANTGVDELSELLVSLNMTKFRPKFDDHHVDFKTLKTMTEEDQLSSLAIPLGPRIKLMKELGIERRASS